MLEGDTKSKLKLRDLVEAGAEIAGGAIGGALGLLGGPLGAVAGGAGGVIAGQALGHIGGELAERMLGPREKTRLGAVLAIAADDIRSRTERGEPVRDDDFFEQKEGRRSKADEVAENVLLKAQREAEERKIPYMGKLLSNITFDKSISAPMAHQIIKAAEALTYRQLVLLRVAAMRQSLRLRGSDYRGQQTFPTELMQVLYECHDLYVRSLVNFGGEVAFGPTDVKPGSMKPQGIGAFVHNLMGLSSIPGAEIEEVAKLLR